MDKSRPIVVTGTAGFIGFHLARRLLNEGFRVIGIDSINDYYDVNLKKARLELLKTNDRFTFYQFNLVDKAKLEAVFEGIEVDYLVHLAAQAGVRYSLTNPQAYIESNITAFVNILEICRHRKIKHLVYASSSSVYGANTVMPFSTLHNVDHPVSLYAASKKANELMAHTYSVNFQLPTTGLRFFTVYGPWGRPDMALFLFTKAILNDQPIDVFNQGEMRRDFTYIDDIVEGIYRLIPSIPQKDESWDSEAPNPSTSFAPFRIFNIGNNSPVPLMEFIETIEKAIGKKAIMNFLPMQKGDVPATFADVNSLQKLVGYKPSTPVETGVQNFVNWYREYYNT